MNEDIEKRNEKVGEDGEKEALVSEQGAPIHFVLENEVQNYGEEPTAWHLSRATYLDAPHDLALLHVVGTAVPSHVVAQLAKRSPAVGDRIHIVGHVKGLYWTYMEGNVAAYRQKMPIDKKGPFLQVSAPVYFGNSGGGCFDEDGKLVGIASFILTSGPNIGFFVHLNNIQDFLKDRLTGE
jgi:S1-C subfamily serine protease